MSRYYGSNYSGHFPTHPGTTSEYYNYTHMGPWDPPEKNATEITFEVNTGQPVFTLTNTTIYWGYRSQIDINVTDAEGKGIDSTYDPIKLRKTNTTTYLTKEDFTDVTITNEGNGNYSIVIPQYNNDTANDWSILTNGTWRVYFVNDINGDATEEWNTSEPFFIKNVPRATALIFGKITNLVTIDNAITFEAVKTRVMIFSPFSFNTYVSGEKFIISEEYFGFVGVRYIFALCKILI